MQYLNGSATDPNDLLSQLEAWLAGLGWTIDNNASEGSGRFVAAHNNGNYVFLASTMNESGRPWQSMFNVNHYGLHLTVGTSYVSGQPFANQTGGTPVGSFSNPIGVGMHLSAGPFSNFHFFADATADNIVIVVEKTPGLFVHIGWGLSILKSGSFTGGPYMFGSSGGYYTSYTFAGSNLPGYTSTSDCPGADADQIGSCPTFVRADVDSFTGKWLGIWVNSTSQDQGYQGKRGESSVKTTNVNPSPQNSYPVYCSSGSSSSPFDFSESLTSVLDGRANLVPPLLWALRDGSTAGYTLLGKIPYVFETNAVGRGFAAGSDYTIGGTTYKLFPNFAVVKQ
jgi:hypothetical protein